MGSLIRAPEAVETAGSAVPNDLAVLVPGEGIFSATRDARMMLAGFTSLSNKWSL